jgi:L-asparaginase
MDDKTTKLLLITTGGTISQEKDEIGTAKSTEESKQHGSDTFGQFLTARARSFKYDFEVTSKGILNKDSSNILPEDWGLMIKTIVDNYDAYDVFLLTHGTNTMGYTAAALSFALGNLGKKVILTGSQISYGYPGSDSVQNLENAIRLVATHPELVGVMAVFGSHIITGSRVKKTNEQSYDAFVTFNAAASLGRIGRTVEINPDAMAKHLAYLQPLARTKSELDVQADFFMDQVASLTEFPGMNPDTFKRLVDCGFKGIIFRATGAGDPNVSPKKLKIKDPNDPDGKKEIEIDNPVWEKGLRKGFEYLMEKEIPIVITTQAPDGKASMDVNEPGILALQELNAIPAHDMSIEAMTVKLAWLLGNQTRYPKFRSAMITNIRGEIVPVRRG